MLSLLESFSMQHGIANKMSLEIFCLCDQNFMIIHIVIISFCSRWAIFANTDSSPGRIAVELKKKGEKKRSVLHLNFVRDNFIVLFFGGREGNVIGCLQDRK